MSRVGSMRNSQSFHERHSPGSGAYEPLSEEELAANAEIDEKVDATLDAAVSKAVAGAAVSAAHEAAEARASQIVASYIRGPKFEHEVLDTLKPEIKDAIDCAILEMMPTIELRVREILDTYFEAAVSDTARLMLDDALRDVRARFLASKLATGTTATNGSTQPNGEKR